MYGLTDPDPALAFPESRILSARESADLYLSLPFGTVDDGSGTLQALPPICKLIWATYDGSTTAQSFINAYTHLGHGDPTVVLVKSTDGAIFGGYAADAWIFDDLFRGTPRSYLFSVTRDVKLPYTGRVKGPKQVNDDVLRQEAAAAHAAELAEYTAIEQAMAEANGGAAPYDPQGRLVVVEYDDDGNASQRTLARPAPRPFVRADAMRAGQFGIQFGLKDLVLSDDFTNCSSEVEQSYGIGLRMGGPEARSILAGSHTFKPETIEVWSIYSDVGSGLPEDDGSADAGSAAPSQ